MAAGPALLCYDGSGPARRAIQVAADLLGGGAAIVMCVWEPFTPSVVAPVSSAVAYSTGLAKEFDEISVDLAGKSADEGLGLASSVGFDAEPLVVRGRPREEIVAAAVERDARVVVLGNRGQGGVGSALYGSVSTAVLHHCPKPVLVVRRDRQPADL